MKIPLVLLPGLLCDQTVWAEQRNALAKRADCVVADYSGYRSINMMAKHVLLSTKADCFALAGHSMGGRVALEIVRLAPTRVTGLALLDTGYLAISDGDAGRQEREDRFRLLELARDKGMREMGENWVQGMVHPERLGTPLYGAILDMIECSTLEKFEAQIAALLGRPDASELLPLIACPTTIICGRQDFWSPLSRHEAMHAAIVSSALRVLEDCGHMSTMEQPAMVSSAMMEWIDRISLNQLNDGLA